MSAAPRISAVFRKTSRHLARDRGGLWEARGGVVEIINAAPQSSIPPSKLKNCPTLIPFFRSIRLTVCSSEQENSSPYEQPRFVSAGSMLTIFEKMPFAARAFCAFIDKLTVLMVAIQVFIGSPKKFFITLYEI